MMLSHIFLKTLIFNEYTAYVLRYYDNHFNF